MLSKQYPAKIFFILFKPFRKSKVSEKNIGQVKARNVNNCNVFTKAISNSLQVCTFAVIGDGNIF